MKNKIIFFLSLVLITSCEKDELGLFEMSYMEDFTIQAGLNTFDAWYFELKNIDSNTDNYLSTFGFDRSEITKVDPKSARLVTLFSDVEYRFVQEVSVRLYQDDPGDYQEIFYRENVPFNTKGEIGLLPTLVDAKEKLTQEKFNIQIRMEFRETPPEFVESRIEFDFIVK